MSTLVLDQNNSNSIIEIRVIVFFNGTSDIPVVVVVGLELRHVSLERRNVLCADTPLCSNLKNIA